MHKPRRNGRSGSTAVEYSVILGIVLLCTAGFASLLGTLFHSDAMNPLAGGQTVASHTDEPEDAEEARPRSSMQSRFGWVGIIVLATFAGAGITWVSRKVTNRMGDDDDDAEMVELAPKYLREKFACKRQQILHYLKVDSDSLAQGHMDVAHLMTKSVLTVTTSTPVPELRELMTEKKIRHLVVADDRHLRGVISDRDLATRTGKLARDIMTPDPAHVTPGTPACAAVTLMLQRHFSCLPIVQDDLLVGVVTTTDLLMALQCHLRLTEQLIGSYEMGSDPVLE